MVQLVKATDGVHKYVAIFKDGKRTSFGAKGMNDYTLTGDKEARERYRERHKKDLETGDPRRAGYLSRFILWGDSTSITANLAAYNKRFGV